MYVVLVPMSMIAYTSTKPQNSLLPDGHRIRPINRVRSLGSDYAEEGGSIIDSAVDGAMKVVGLDDQEQALVLKIKDDLFQGFKNPAFKSMVKKTLNWLNGFVSIFTLAQNKKNLIGGYTLFQKFA